MDAHRRDRDPDEPEHRVDPAQEKPRGAAEALAHLGVGQRSAAAAREREDAGGIHRLAREVQERRADARDVQREREPERDEDGHDLAVRGLALIGIHGGDGTLPSRCPSADACAGRPRAVRLLMLAALVLAAARRAERAIGPGAALAMITAALETAADDERRTLILGGLGSAARAGDAAAFERLAARWETTGDDVRELRMLSLVARLDADGQLERALRLARAEVERRRGAEALFVLGALLEQAGRTVEAVDAWDEAARRAPGSAVAQRATRASLRHAPPEHAELAEAELARSPAPADAIRLAPAALASARLYARVRVLDRLAELARDPGARAAALRVAVAHADLRGGALTPIERDRLVAVARAAGADDRLVRALGRGAESDLDESAARDALIGRAPAEGPERAATLALRALAAVVAASGSAALLLSALAAHPPSPAGWTAVLAGLAAPASRAAAARCVERWLDALVAPPRGFTSLASALEQGALLDLAERAGLAAVRAGESGAREALGALLASRARAAYLAGERAKAKALLERSLAIDPDGA